MKQPILLLALGLALTFLGVSAAAQTAPPVPNAPAFPIPGDPYVLGRTYRVTTTQGTAFTGALVSMSLTALEFDALELGHVSLERGQIRRADLQGPAVVGTKAGYFDIGNGNRLFFAPTGRGLRKGEASLQDVNFYLVGVNYGITDNFSFGGYVSAVPGVSVADQLLVLTPKFSFPISEKLHVGAGLLYMRVSDFSGNNTGVGAGIGYGVLTYGSADNNLTLGLGYGFVQGDIGSTPILQVGGQTRVSRRVSLVSENYIVANAKAGMGGLYGVKINWRRTSLGLGAAYFYAFGYDETDSYTYYDPNGLPVTANQTYHNGGDGFSTYIVPIYYDFTFRFGKGAK